MKKVQYSCCLEKLQKINANASTIFLFTVETAKAYQKLCIILCNWLEQLLTN